MKARRARTSEPQALELIEQAIRLLRQSPFSAWAAYYLGSLPFFLGLLYFWGDMSRDASASQRLAEWPLVLSGLFVWMKCWHTVCVSHWMEELQQSESKAWTWGRLCRMIAAQSAIQPGALFLLPVALLLTVPFGWVYAFYENVSILGDGREDRLRQVWRRSWQQAGLWPMQNHWLIWLTSPYLLVLTAALSLVIVPWFQAVAPSWSLGIMWLAVFLLSLLMLAVCPLSVAVALNLGAALILIPEFVKMLLGIETQFTRGAWGMINSTWLAMTCALTYLVLDPLVKSVYVLRCFYGEARHSALDLRSELKRLRLRRSLPLVILFLTIVLASPAAAQERLPRSGSTATNGPTIPAAQPLPTNAADSVLAPSITPEELDQSVQHVLAGREYRWRLPREQQPRVQESWLVGLFRNLTQKVRSWMRASWEWLDRLLRPRQPDSSGGPSKSGWLASLRPLVFAGILVLLLALAFLFWQRWRERRQKVVVAAGETVTSVPDLTQESAAASQLPEEGWLALAADFISQGEPRLALRALYFASLADLERRQLLTIARHKSNLDYLRELGRRAHAHPALQTLFGENVAAFERVWYGFHEASLETVTLFRANIERIRAIAR
jgi:Domain of unknown function (DUF4129)